MEEPKKSRARDSKARKKSTYPWKGRKEASGIPAQPLIPTIPKNYNLIPVPRDEEEVKKLADQLTAWSQTQNSLFIEDFPLSHNYSVKRFFNLAKQHEYFDDALNNALYTIGIRRESCAAEDNPQVYMKYIATYNERYREHDERNVQLKNAIPTLSKTAEQYTQNDLVAEAREAYDQTGNQSKTE